MNRCEVLFVVVVLSTIPVSLMSWSDVSDASSYGSQASPLSEVVFTVSPSDGFSAVAYPGAYVKLTVTGDDLDQCTVSVAPSGTGLTVGSDDVISGSIEKSATITMSETSGKIVGHATIIVVEVDGEATVSTTNDNTCELTADGVVRFREMTLTGGSLPDGMTVDEYAVLSGIPTKTGDYYFTLQGRAELDAGMTSDPYTFHVAVLEPESTTTLSSYHLYAVEGDTVTLTVHGSVSDLSEYWATVATTGGRISTEEATDGTEITVTCPQVNGTTDIFVTVTSDVDGATESKAVATITVVDRLQVSTPTVGTVSSR